MNLLTAIQNAITSDGGVSADYTLVMVISVCGFLIIALAGFAFNSINKKMETMSDDFTQFRKDFHEFVQMQAGINARMEERTKDK